jgi:hypothetical protein
MFNLRLLTHLKLLFLKLRKLKKKPLLLRLQQRLLLMLLEADSEEMQLKLAEVYNGSA